MSIPKLEAQLYCQKAKVNTVKDKICYRTIVLEVKDNHHLIHYYDGFKFINTFGPLSSAEIEYKYYTTSTLIIDHVKKDSKTIGPCISYDHDQISYKITLKSEDKFMCLYLDYKDYKNDPLQLQKENLKTFVNKLITTMPH